VTREEPVVFVVDDDSSVREGIMRLLESREIRAEAFKTAEEFLARPRPARLACLVLDVRLPGVSGLELQRQLIRIAATIPTVFISGHADVPISVQAMKAGAVEFLTKPFRNQQLLDAIQQALERDRVERAHRAELADLQRRIDSLTRGEREVMRLVVAGLLNKQIASRLGVAEITVKVRRARIMEKMKAPAIVDLARIVERLRVG